MAYAFRPKKSIRSFRDLEVYQKTLECSVIVAAEIAPTAAKLGFARVEQLADCALSAPLLIAEAHSLRFADFALALGYLEKAMAACNKAVAYLDHLKGRYGAKANPDLIDDVASRYLAARLKMFRLERAWRQYREKAQEESPA